MEPREKETINKAIEIVWMRQDAFLDKSGGT